MDPWTVYVQTCLAARERYKLDETNPDEWKIFKKTSIDAWEKYKKEKHENPIM